MGDHWYVEANGDARADLSTVKDMIGADILEYLEELRYNLVLQGLALEVGQGEEGLPVSLVDFVDRANVLMI